MHKVYLAGPISGLNFEGATDWREDTKKALELRGIRGISPMRNKEHLVDVGILPALIPEDQGVMSSHRGIMTRDRWDCTRADAVLFNLLGAERVSIGTMMELAWTDLARIPSVVVMEPEGNLHDHGMVREAIGFRVETLEGGIAVLHSLFFDD